MNRIFPATLRHGSGHLMELDPARLLLEYRDPAPIQKRVTQLQPFGLIPEPDLAPDRAGAALYAYLNQTPRRVWVKTQDGGGIARKTLESLGESPGHPSLVGPVYRLEGKATSGSMLCPLPHVLLIRPARSRSSTANDELVAFLRTKGLREVPEKSRFLAGYRYFALADPGEGNVYELRDALLRETERIAAVAFENMPMQVPFTAQPSDTYYARQWGMDRIQAGGAGTTGWDIGTGANVTVAILDEGVDLNHPDLNVSGNGTQLDTLTPGGGSPQNGNGHGTCCAGLAAARYDNGQGVAGVAGSATVLPIAMVYWTDAEVAAGIQWAVQYGAHVVSMSFGAYGPGEPLEPKGWDFDVIDPAIADAVDVAGLVLVASAGNDGSDTLICYPARNGRVIAVGGSDQKDARKTPGSPDGECWESNYGPQLSVVAPSVLQPSTDIQGGGGFNTSGGFRRIGCVGYKSAGPRSGDYFFQFTGTSAATPLVAGIACAMLGVNPALTSAEVREIIELTACKVGGAYAPVAGYPNGTRNAEMGYGRVNMLGALQEAQRRAS